VCVCVCVFVCVCVCVSLSVCLSACPLISSIVFWYYKCGVFSFEKRSTEGIAHLSILTEIGIRIRLLTTAHPYDGYMSIISVITKYRVRHTVCVCIIKKYTL
jgi:hypothetical protein